MKTIRTLQILVYVVFGLFLLQNILPGACKGFMEGANWEYNRMNGKELAEIKLLPSVFIDGNLITHQTGNVLKAGTDYTFNNVNIISDVRVNNKLIQTPWWFELIKFALALFAVIVFFKIAKTINKIILLIYKGTTFDEFCINQIRKTGVLILIYSFTDYAWQWLEYTEQRMLIHSPLKVINTATFSFEILLTSIFVFIIAEAFKQGRELKEQQDLTI